MVASLARRVFHLLAALAIGVSPLQAIGGDVTNAPEIKFNVRYEGYTPRLTDGHRESEDEEKPALTIKQLTRQIDSKPSAKAYSERAVLQQVNGDNDCALSDMTKAIEMEPSWRLYLMRSLLYRLQNEETKSRIDLESALLVVPKEDAPAALAIAGLATGPDGSSIERLTKAIELEPKNADYLLMRSHFNLHNKKPQDAITDIRAAMKLGHDSVFARYYLCQASWRAGDSDDALKEYEKAFEAFPESLAIAQARAKFLMKAPPRLKEEQNLLDSAIRCCELTEWEDADSLILLGDAYKKAGEEEAAIEAYSEAEAFADDAQLEEIASALKPLK
jgi:tetratricopeptide (TPR) repeat protein